MTEFVAADVLAAWAGGLAAMAGLVAAWRIVGPGFLWLAAGTSALFGLPSLTLDFDVAPLVAVAALVIAAALARRPQQSGVAFGLASVGFVIAASGSGVLGAVTAAIFLGGVTAEMLLGHWYLVDPRLPRWALHALDGIALAGLGGEVALLGWRGVFDWAGPDAVLGWTFVVMAIASALLLVAVWLALREPGYPAVMAATGLSYLTMLTAVGASVVGRIVLEGVV